MRLASLAVAASLALLLSGCSDDVSNGPEGQSVSREGSLAYNGASPGSHAHSFECGDGSGQSAFFANLGGGTASVTVKDSAGNTVYSKTASGPGQTTDSKDLEGASGTWTLSATRTAGFNGQYAFGVDCE